MLMATSKNPRDEFSEIQSRYFEAAEEEKYFHQTRHSYFAKTEKALLDVVAPRSGERLLEVGCGEGGNLYFLAPSAGEIYGVDLFSRKLEFAKSQLRRGQFVCSSAEALPFPDASFDVVLCRDVLHHLPRREPALQEMSRVCRTGGRMLIIEPNGRNPIMALQPRLVKAETAIRQNTPTSLERLVSDHLGCPSSILFRQPLPVFRAVLHYRYGFPRLGNWRIVQGLFDALNWAAARVIPKSRWAYVVLEVEKR